MQDVECTKSNVAMYRPLYSNFLFNFTITWPLLAGQGKVLLVEITSIGTLHIAPLSLADWPFGMILSFLN